MDDVLICNLALGAVGKDSIENLQTQKTPGAEACRLWFDHARRQTLAQFDWNGARRRLALSLHTDPVAGETWALRYSWPADCVAFRKIQNPMGDLAPPVPFTTETSVTGAEKTILTNQEEAVGVYTFDQKNFDVLGNWFSTTMAHLLASLVAVRLTGDEKRRDNNLIIWRNMAAQASAHDANQNRVEELDAPWITARN